MISQVRLPFRKEKELYLSLYKVLGFYPKKISYYKQALLHKSVVAREKGKRINNERLEFLGDSILGAVVSDIVYKHFERKGEGFLTNTRSKIVQRPTLNRLAEEMGITRLIKYNSNISSHNNYTGGNAFEALVGAIYLDRGYKACKKFVEKQILNHLINLDKVAYKEINFKSKLLEWSQKNRIQLEFRQTDIHNDEKGNPVFSCMVMLENIEGCSGTGYSKKESQQVAAKDTLTRLRKNPQFIDEVFAAKTNRTKMEEEPVHGVPETEEKQDFIISSKSKEEEPVERFKDTHEAVTKTESEPEDFDFSDIKTTIEDPSREEIIAAAEAAAFEEE